MESHILNTYHEPHFRPIGQEILRIKNDSVSSESSYNQSSPEYPQTSVPQSRLSMESNTVNWDQIQTINITQTSHNTSWDYKNFDIGECMEDYEQNGLRENVGDSGEELEKAIYNQEINVDCNDDEMIEFEDYRNAMHLNSHHTQMTESNDTEDNSLVEGRDYDVIIVYPVNPDLVDISSDDDISLDDDIKTPDYSTDNHDFGAEHINDDNRSYREVNYEDRNTISQDGLDIDLDSPLLFNIEEYLVNKNNNEHLLDTDGHHIKDVDKYLIKDNGKDITAELNIDDFFIKNQLPEEESTQFNIPDSTPNVEEFLISSIKKDVIEEKTEPDNKTDNCQVIDLNNTDNAVISINKADLEVLPNIEELKDYLLEGMTYTEFDHIQTSCLVPQSDIDVVKTCMKMNGDLSDLNFKNAKNNTENSSKGDDRSINNKMDTKLDPEKNDLGHKDEKVKMPKKLHSLPNLKDGQIIPEPEVLPGNSRLATSRDRSCKSKQAVYHLNNYSDEEKDKNTNNKKNIKKKRKVKTSVQSKCLKKLSPSHCESDNFREKSNSSVMIQSAFEASDRCCQKTTGSIRLTIKNKSKVLLHFEHTESQKDENIDKCENSDREITKNGEKNIQKLDTSNGKVENIVDAVTIKEKPHPNNKNVNTTLFSNKQQVTTSNDELNKCMFEVDTKKEAKELSKKKKQICKPKKDTCSNNSSAFVSPKVSDTPNLLSTNVIKCPQTQTKPNGLLNSLNKPSDKQNLFDPIKEAARTLLVAKKRKAEARMKREEDILNRKLLKVKNLKLQPLLSDAEMIKIEGMTKPEIMPVPMGKLQSSADYEKIILVNIGTITDEKMFNNVEKPVVEKKSDHALKTDKRSPVEKKTYSNIKIDKKRYKDITTTLESLRKQVKTKIFSNSLFSSIQDVVMKNAPKETEEQNKRHKLLQEKRDCKFFKTTIIREYDPKAEHGEGKVILHLDKHRCKPTLSNMGIQTIPIAEIAELPILAPMPKQQAGPVSRKRKYSDVSLSTNESRSLKSNEREQKQLQPENRVSKPKELRLERNETKEKTSREIAESITPPLRRKPTFSESSDSSSSLLSSSFSSSFRCSSSSTSSNRSRGSYSSYKRDEICNQKSYRRESNTPVEERRIVFVGRLEKDVTKQTLKNQFSKFGRVTDVRVHSKEDGYRYGFVTYQHARDAWSAVEASSTFPQYDVGFGGRRAFCRQSYADLDGLDVNNAESAYYGEAVPRPIRRDDDMSFEQMLLETKKKISQRKN